MIAETNFVLFSCISGLLLMQLWKILIATTMRDDFIHIYVWRTFVLLLHFPVMTQQTFQAHLWVLDRNVDLLSVSETELRTETRVTAVKHMTGCPGWKEIHLALLHRQDKRGHFVLHCLDTNTCRIAVLILVFPNRRATLNLKYFYIIGSW